MLEYQQRGRQNYTAPPFRFRVSLPEEKLGLYRALAMDLRFVDFRPVLHLVDCDKQNAAFVTYDLRAHCGRCSLRYCPQSTVGISRYSR